MRCNVVGALPASKAIPGVWQPWAWLKTKVNEGAWLISSGSAQCQWAFNHCRFLSSSCLLCLRRGCCSRSSCLSPPSLSQAVKPLVEQLSHLQVFLSSLPQHCDLLFPFLFFFPFFAIRGRTSSCSTRFSSSVSLQPVLLFQSLHSLVPH